MIQEHILGTVQEVREDGTAVITAAFPSLDRAMKRQYGKVEIILPDGRIISPEQRRKTYVLIGEIADYVDGCRDESTVEETKSLMKMQFMMKQMAKTERKLFSLADCDMTTAREFINFLVDFIIAEDIPTNIPLIEQADDIERYVYTCCMHKKCAVCGERAELHHVDTVGANGGNREKMDHIGLRVLPLCRKHHDECHTAGRDSFLGKYHLETVTVDEKIAKTYRLKHS